MAEHALHSQRSSLADIDYYNDTHSVSAYSDDASSRYPSALHSRSPSTQDPGQQQQYQQSVRKQPSLAQISVPSFSAFRSQASSIPISSPRGAHRKQLSFQAHTPRAHSLAELPSPRLVDPSSRPLSTDTVPQHPTGLTKLTNVISPPASEASLANQEHR